MKTQSNHPRHGATAAADGALRSRRRFLDVLVASIGDPLELRRQSINPHDERAIEVFWREHELGYLPHLDNAAAASLADRAHALHVEISGIDDSDEGWESVRLRGWV